MRAVLVALLIGASVGAAAAAEPPPAVTYTLSAEQKAVLNRALVAADFWLSVRAAAAANSVEGRGFELERLELGALAQEMLRQEAAAAAEAKKKAAAEANPLTAPIPQPTPQP